MNSRIRWLVAGAACGALMAAPRIAAAQSVTPQSAARYALAGVVAGTDGAAVPDAEITIVSVGADSVRVRSDSAGKFRASGLTTAAVTVRVRRLGYQPKSLDLMLREGSPPIVITLEPNPAELGTVKIREIAAEPDARLREFYARRATNSFGRYFEASEIEKRRPQFISEMFRQVPGATLSASGRIGNTLRIRGCPPLVWVDGVRIPNSQIDEVVTPSDVAAVEIYNSFAGIPAQYFDRSATCGTILVWSRAK
jgi:Carboxypeptidase regulatory-like domain/TonB-dependent Receptor Plug Domain